METDSVRSHHLTNWTIAMDSIPTGIDMPEIRTEAIKRVEPPGCGSGSKHSSKGSIPHSDRRGQHCAHVCQKLLCESDKQASMNTKTGTARQSITTLTDSN